MKQQSVNIFETIIAYIAVIIGGILSLVWWFVAAFVGALVTALLAFLFGGCVAHKTTTVYPTYKGSSVPDRSKPGYVIRDGVIYPAYKGSQVPDPSRPGYVIRVK